MNNNTKNSKFITALIVIIFIVLAYALVKSFFGDSPGNKNKLRTGGSFNIVYDLDKEVLDDMYDETRTYKVVLDTNYGKATKDIKKNKVYLSPSKMEYIFTNNSDNKKNYKLTIDSEWLNVYKVDAINNKLYFVVLGSDLKYYEVNISIKKNPEDVNLEEKSWVTLGKTSDLSIYDNSYYKVIDDVCCITLDLPVVFDKDKFTDKVYDNLRNKIIDSISIEEYQNYDNNYLKMNLKNIKLDDRVTLLLKNSKISQYYSSNNIKTNISYTVIYLYNKSNNLVGIYDIDSIEEYTNYLSTLGLKEREYTYKDINTKLYYLDKDVYSDGTAYQAIIFEIGDKHYMISPLSYTDKLNDTNINAWIDNLVDGILEIK